MTKARDGALPAMAGEAGDSGNLEEIGMTPAIARRMEEAEALTKQMLADSPQVTMRIPRGIFATATARVFYNGVGLEVEISRDVTVPAPIAKLLQTRIDSVLQMEETARANSRGS